MESDRFTSARQILDTMFREKIQSKRNNEPNKLGSVIAEEQNERKKTKENKNEIRFGGWLKSQTLLCL